MKKNLFLLGMAIAALSSCTQEEVVSVPDSRAIGFDAFTGKNTRALTDLPQVPETNLDALKQKDKGFFVYGGYETVTDVFNDTHVTYNSGSNWAYSPISYWVPNQKYKLVAYAPALDRRIQKEFDYSSGNLKFTNYVSGQTHQVDFVVGEKTIDSKQSGNDPVQFSLKHALSKVKITLVNGFRAGVNVEIKDFALTGINTVGTFTTSSSVAGVWSDINTPGEYKAQTEKIVGQGNTYHPEYIVIPQTFEENVVSVTFTATLTDKNGLPVPSEGKNQKKLTLKIPANTWNINNCYNYTATIDGETFELQNIAFGDPTVDKWGDYTDISVDPEETPVP